MLGNMDLIRLDRRDVEQLFGVGERRARQLMTGLSGIRAGNAAAAAQWAVGSCKKLDCTASMS